MTRRIRLLGGMLVWFVPSAASAQPTVRDTASPTVTDSSGATATPGTSGTTVPSQSPILVYPGVPSISATNPATASPGAQGGAIVSPAKDGFELNTGSAANTLRGNKGAFAIIGQPVRAINVPAVHTVRRGDTLWELCGHYLGNSWEWPRIWSYNPDVRNPNWIYPGDQIRMRSADEAGNGLYPSSGGDRDGLGRKGLRDGGNAGGAAAGLGQSGRVVPETVFLRNEAYIEDPQKDVLGEVVGAKEEQMLLGQGNHVYLDIKPGSSLQVGQELTLFEQSRKPEPVEGARQPPGEIILVKGTVQIEAFDPKKNVAKARILESVDAIERGTKVGSVGRRYLVVSPMPSKVTVWTRLMAGVYPHVFLGQNQLVFIDHGSEDGLKPGNRLLVVRRGDTWRRSLDTGSKTARYRMRVDVQGHAESEPTQLKRDDGEFPEEIVGELRIVHAHKWSSLAIVTASQRELYPGDRAVAREGY